MAKKLIRFLIIISNIFFLNLKAYSCILHGGAVIGEKFNAGIDKSSYDEIIIEFSSEICQLKEKIPILRPAEKEWLDNELKSTDGNRKFQAWESVEFSQKYSTYYLEKLCSMSENLLLLGKIRENNKHYIIDTWLAIAEILSYGNFHSYLEKLINNNVLHINKESNQNVRYICNATVNNILTMVRDLYNENVAF